MKARLVALVVVSLTCAHASPPQHKHWPPPPPANAPLAPGALPSSVIQPWLDGRLNNLLAPLDRGGLKHPAAATDLRSAIADAMAKAPPEKQPAFQAAMQLCNVLRQAADEREKAVATLHGAGSHPSSDLTAVRKHVEQRNTVRNQAFFAHAAETQWQQRSAELRQQISGLYARERDLEAKLNVAASPPAVAIPNETITLQKPTTIRVKYGTATLPAGTVLRVLRRDGTGIVVDYSGEPVTLPP